DKVLATWQLSYQPVPMSDPQAVKHALEQRPVRAVWVETPTNPLLSIVDITALAVMCADAGALLVVGNTFASPYLQNPLALGPAGTRWSTRPRSTWAATPMWWVGRWSWPTPAWASAWPFSRTRPALSQARLTPG